MKLNRIWPFAVIALLASASPLFATVPAGYVQVTAARVQDSTGTMLANGTVVFCPVNGSGTPISYQLNGIGPVSEQCVSALVTSGAFSIQLADSSLTIPLNLCYNLTITDNVNGKLIIQPGYGCVQPSGFGTAVTGSLAWCTAGNLSGPGGTCDLDLYTPNLTALVEQQPGSVGPQGPPGPAGNCHWRGNWAASTAYAADDCYAESTNGYAVVTAYTSGSSFGSTDTANTVQIAVGCPISGCTFTGGVTLAGNPSANLQAAPKQYADAIVATETSRAEAAETTNASAVSTETTRAEAAEAANATAIGTETTRAEAAEATNATAISTDTAAIATETTRAEAAETTDLATATTALATANEALVVAGGGGPTTTTQAQVNEADNLAASTSVAASRPTAGGSGSFPSKKDSTNCGMSYSGGHVQPNGENVGHRYCSLSDQGAAEEAGGPSQGYISLTQSGAGSISPVNSNGAGGTDAPASMITDYGLSTYDSICSGDPIHNAPTGVPGLNPPACGSNVTAHLSETTDGTYSSGSTLWPTNWNTTVADASDHWYRDFYFMVPDVTKSNRYEFDDNESDKEGDYFGPGMSFNMSTGQLDFLPQANNYVGHGTGAPGCASSWCPLTLNLKSGSTAMTGCNGTSCTIQSGHWYHARKFEHRAGTVTEEENVGGTMKAVQEPTYFYDEFDIADCGTSGTSCPTDFARYMLADPNNNAAPPEGWEKHYGWPQAFDTQWQLYPTGTSATSDIYVVNDVIQFYTIVQGTTSTNYVSAPANLGDFEFNVSSALGTNSDSTSGDTTAVSCSGASYDTTWFLSSPGSANFNAVGDECTATLPASESTFTQRFYLSSEVFSTSSGGSSVIYEAKNSSTLAYEVYLNDGANNLTLYVPTSTTSGPLTCILSQPSSSQATIALSPDYVDITWVAGSTTGQITAQIDGVAPTDSTCSWLGTNINTSAFSSGTITGINDVVFGYLTDTGATQNWSIDFDMVGFSSGSTFLGAGIPATTSTTPLFDAYGAAAAVAALTGSLTTTSASSDAVSLPGMISGGHCAAPAPTNSSAASASTAWVSSKGAGTITVTHATTSGMTYDIECWPY